MVGGWSQKLDLPEVKLAWDYILGKIMNRTLRRKLYKSKNCF